MAVALLCGGSESWQQRRAGELRQSLHRERQARRHEARMRTPALALRDAAAQLVRLLREPGLAERPAEVADVSDLPLDLAERHRAFRVQDARHRAGEARIDHPLLLERLEPGFARRHLQVPEYRPVAIEARPVGPERSKRVRGLRS